MHVRVFFYGTFMDAGVLAEHGVVPGELAPARLDGHELTVRPRANVSRADGACVYGSAATVAHEDLEALYSGLAEGFGLTYLPEAVLVETRDGGYRPALCYVAPRMAEAPADRGYVLQLAACLRALGHPEWYARRVESFAEVGGETE